MSNQGNSCFARNYPESQFGGFSDLDGTIRFYARVNALLNSDSVVLDVGCGRGKCIEDPVSIRSKLQILKGKAKHVIGIDVDPAAKSNTCIDEFHLLEGPTWPVPDASVDLVVSDWVLEHVEDPDQYFAETARVIKPGGYACIRTPNSRGYVALCSRMVPNRHHASVLRKAQHLDEGGASRQEEDVFPTLYRCNTRGKIAHQLRKHGFDACVYGFDAEPGYLSFSPALYYLGTWYHKFCPGFFKNALFAFAKKV